MARLVSRLPGWRGGGVRSGPLIEWEAGILFSMIWFVSERIGLNYEVVGRRTGFIVRGKAGH